MTRASKPIRQLWDSMLFIVYVEGEEDERVSVIRSLIAHVNAGRVTPVISTLAIAEVRGYRAEDETPTALGKEKRRPVDPANAEEIRQVFGSDQLERHALSPGIAEKAAEIGNVYPSLLPPDCIHIATAIKTGVEVLLTWDGAGRRRRPREMLRYDGLIDGLAIKQPYDPFPTLDSLIAANVPQPPSEQSPTDAQD